MERLTRWVLAHRKLVAGSWILLTIVGMMLSGKAVDAMDQKFTIPDREADAVNLEIARSYGGTGQTTLALLPVVTLPDGTSAASARKQLLEVEQTVRQAIPGARVAGYGSTGDRAFLSDDGQTAFAVAYPPADPDSPFGGNPDAEKDARKALADVKIDGAPVHLTGYEALVAQEGGGEGPGVLVEALVGGLGALIVLAFVFGSFLAIIPLLMAIPAVMTAFLAIYGITTFAGVSPIVQFLVALIGLGVAIDYALIIVVRWREELAKGADKEEAIVRSMQHAGKAVVFSGTTVAVGLLALVVLPIPFLRSVGYGGMLIPLVSVLVACTLLPVVLYSWGPKLDWPHRRTDENASRAWTRWAQAIVRRRWLSAVAALAVLLALAGVATGIKPGISNVDSVAKPGDAKDGLVALQESGIGSGVMLAHEILVRSTDPQKVVDATKDVDGVHGAVAPDSPDWRRNNTAIVEVIPIPDGSSSRARDVTDAVRAAAHATGSDVRLGGQQASNDEFVDAVYGTFPLMIALIAVLTFILLARAFRSLLLPLKAVVLNLISVGAAWGVMTLVWQNGHGSEALFGIAATGSLESWIPLMVFAFLFGLSMDYEVFILARMREEYDATGDTNEAVVRGIGRTGRLVTSAALILFLTFVAMGSGPETQVKVMATGLAAGILIDATIVRALLVPAAVSLFGRWNWWLPPSAARVLRVAPSV